MRGSSVDVRCFGVGLRRNFKTYASGYMITP